jgi:hypothetical protein
MVKCEGAFLLPSSRKMKMHGLHFLFSRRRESGGPPPFRSWFPNGEASRPISLVPQAGHLRLSGVIPPVTTDRATSLR